MDKEDALALLDVMRMQTVHEPPGVDGHLLACAFSDLVAGRPVGTSQTGMESSQFE